MMMFLCWSTTFVPLRGLVLEHSVEDLVLELLDQEEFMLQGLMEEVSKAGDDVQLLAYVRVVFASRLGEDERAKGLEGYSLGVEEIREGRDYVNETHGWSTRFSNQYYNISNDQPDITLRLDYCSMTKNPFTRVQSPILQLYTLSQSKSQSHSTLFRSRSHSYRQFQVKIIRNALEQNHIIEKDPNLPRARQIKRQRQLSHYYGAEVFKQNVHVPQAQKSPITTESKYEKNSQIGSLLNIQQQTMKCLNSQRFMGYESNYNIYQKPSLPHVAESSNSLKKSHSSRSSGRKTSFFSEVGNGKEQGEDKRSRFQQGRKVDRVREEYYDIGPSQKVLKVMTFRKYA